LPGNRWRLSPAVDMRHMFYGCPITYTMGDIC